jgi:HK97 family phage major capsid protein
MSAVPKTIKVPANLTRAREGGVEMVGEGEKKELRISISSDTPYLRYDWWTDEEYYEVLDHSPGGFEDGRLKNGMPMLYQHERNKHIGRARSFSSDGKRIMVSDIIWSESDFAKEKRSDMEAGVLVDTSVGYSLIGEGECIGAKDGIPIYRFKWEPHEFSLVSIPADFSVGVGREMDPAKREELQKMEFRELKVSKMIDSSQKREHSRKKETAMADENNPTQQIDVVAERGDAVKAERARVSEIQKYAKAFNQNAKLKTPLNDLERTAINEGHSFDDFRQAVMDNWESATRVEGADADPNIGMSKKERRQFSLAKVMLEAGSAKGLTGLEKAAHEAAVQKYAKDGRTFEGVCIPHDMQASRVDEDWDMSARQIRNLAESMEKDQHVLLGRSLSASVFGSGGFLVGTDLLAGSYIDFLRNVTLIGNGPFGIIELGGLVGNVAIPKQNSTATVYWLAEGAPVNESNFTGGQLYLTPRRMAVQTNFTKQLLAQSTPSVEMLVRNDIALAMGVEEDRVIIQGSGLNGEPVGITNTTGVGADITFGGAATWQDIVDFEYYLENANVRSGQMAFLTTPLTKSRLRATLKVASSTFPIYLWEQARGEYPPINGSMGGIMGESPAYATKNAPSSNVVIFGVFNNNVTKARWAGFDLVVDPYTGAGSETIKTYVNQWIDVAIRYPQAFEVSTDAPAAP